MLEKIISNNNSKKMGRLAEELLTIETDFLYFSLLPMGLQRTALSTVKRWYESFTGMPLTPRNIKTSLEVAVISAGIYMTFKAPDVGRVLRHAKDTAYTLLQHYRN